MLWGQQSPAAHGRTHHDNLNPEGSELWNCRGSRPRSNTTKPSFGDYRPHRPVQEESAASSRDASKTTLVFLLHCRECTNHRLVVSPPKHDDTWWLLCFQDIFFSSSCMKGLQTTVSKHPAEHYLQYLPLKHPLASSRIWNTDAAFIPRLPPRIFAELEDI